jgi:hypothetical protein
MLPSEVTQFVQFVQFVPDHKLWERSYLEARTGAAYMQDSPDCPESPDKSF